eukprot:CAMPEP_0195103296 /NCGR_PEP_ID=MMETSP0448-20130528/71748_1 /TAXON_ID=66468 /ORGANISM="Heterocapsa triquestra, Strain CCMP 448" /LENGTH=32 /DNA_ID= /DNA_START= /DNA_END= /DNA_ORIENTATION=
MAPHNSGFARQISDAEASVMNDALDDTDLRAA